jgi:hypothetical protein
MSLPTEFDFALIKMGDGATPTEVFTVICGIESAQVNQVANTSDHFVRDCTNPGRVPYRRVKTNGKQMDITGSGLSNADTIQDFIDALGLSKNYKIEGYQRDGTDAGNLLGTYAGPFVMTANNLNIAAEATGEITLASDGAWTYSAAS